MATQVGLLDLEKCISFWFVLFDKNVIYIQILCNVQSFTEHVYDP